MKHSFILFTLALGLIITGCSKAEDDLTPDKNINTNLNAGILKSQPCSYDGLMVGITWQNPSNIRCGLPFRCIDFEGSGNLPHFGKSTVTTQYCGNTVISFPPPFYGNIIDGEWVLTAANGDKIYNAFTATYLVTHIQSGWYEQITGQGTIKGGTGKFKGASGSFECGGTINLGTGFLPEWSYNKTTFWFSGTLEY